jgi:hypothetical protein
MILVAEIRFSSAKMINGREGRYLYRDTYMVQVSIAGLYAMEVWCRSFAFLPKAVQIRLK